MKSPLVAVVPLVLIAGIGAAAIALLAGGDGGASGASNGPCPACATEGAGAAPSVGRAPEGVDVPAAGLVSLMQRLGAFELEDAAGGTLSSEDLRGKVWVAAFVFTTCDGPCPRMTQTMKDLQDRTRGRDDLHFVTVTVDPARDTRERLVSYGERYGADMSRWHFVRADQETTRDVMTGQFRLGYQGSMLNHSAKLVLVDQNGFVRGYYDGRSVEERIRLRRDALTLLTGERP